MLSICYICLRSDRKLWTLDFCTDLEYFYDEMTNFGAGDPSQNFCSVCIYKLKKCHEFQKCCQIAVEKLKIWRKQAKDARKSLSVLHKQMPASKIKLCNKKNVKVYFSQSTDLNTTSSMQLFRSNHPNIVTLNIPRDTSIENIDCDIENFDEHAVDTLFTNEESNVKNESDELADNKNETFETIKIIEVKIENDSGSSDENFHNELGSDDDSDFEPKMFNNDDITESESNALINELENFLIQPRPPNETLLKKENNKIDKRTKSACKRKSGTKSDVIVKKPKTEKNNLESMKMKLKEKFEKYSPIKSPKGNIIEMDIVLNNLDKIKWKNALEKTLREPGPLSDFAIRQLSSLQDTVIYGDVFNIYHLRDPKQIQAEFERRRHLAKYKKNEHRCEICITSYPHRRWLDHHMKTSHNSELPFECTTCHSRHASKRGLNSHVRSHKTVYKCKLCDFVTGFRSTMINHFNNHKGNHYSCKYCEAKFSSPSCLFKHINKLHEPKHICQFCASSFKTMVGLQKHKFLKHKNETFIESEHNKKCEECNVVFLSDEIYNEHVKKSCRTRMIIVTNKTSNPKFRDHKKKKLSHNVSRTRIKNIEKGGDYLCQICGLQIRHRSEIEVHALKHTGSRPYACLKCPKSFYNQLDLKTHTLRHFPPTYECKVCGKKFHTSTGLSTHNRIHVNDRRYVCDICGRGFLHPGALRAHVAGVHHHIRRIRKPRP